MLRSVQSVLGYLFGPSATSETRSADAKSNATDLSSGSGEKARNQGVSERQYRDFQHQRRTGRGLKASSSARVGNIRGGLSSARTRGRVQKLVAPPGAFPGLSQPAADPYLEQHEFADEEEPEGDEEHAGNEEDGLYDDAEDYEDQYGDGADNDEYIDFNGRRVGSIDRSDREPVHRRMVRPKSDDSRAVLISHQQLRRAPLSQAASVNSSSSPFTSRGLKIHPNQLALQQQEQQAKQRSDFAGYPPLPSAFSIISDDFTATMRPDEAFNNKFGRPRVGPVYRENVSEEALRALNNRARKSLYGVRGGGVLKSDLSRSRLTSIGLQSRKRGYAEDLEYDVEDEEGPLHDHLDEFELRKRRNLAVGFNNTASSIKRRKHHIVHFQDEADETENPRIRGLIGSPSSATPSKGVLKKRSVRQPPMDQTESNEELPGDDELEYYEEDEIYDPPKRARFAGFTSRVDMERRKATPYKRAPGTMIQREDGLVEQKGPGKITTGKRKQIGLVDDDYLWDNEDNEYFRDRTKDLSAEDGWITPTSYRLKRTKLNVSSALNNAREDSATSAAVASPAKMVKRQGLDGSSPTKREETRGNAEEKVLSVPSSPSPLNVNPQRSISSVTTSRGRVKLSGSVSSPLNGSPLLSSATPIKDHRHLALSKMPTPVLHKPLNEDDVDRLIDQNISKAEEKAANQFSGSTSKEKSVKFKLPDEEKKPASSVSSSKLLDTDGGVESTKSADGLTSHIVPASTTLVPNLFSNIEGKVSDKENSVAPAAVSFSGLPTFGVAPSKSDENTLKPSFGLLNTDNTSTAGAPALDAQTSLTAVKSDKNEDATKATISKGFSFGTQPPKTSTTVVSSEERSKEEQPAPPSGGFVFSSIGAAAKTSEPSGPSLGSFGKISSDSNSTSVPPSSAPGSSGTTFQFGGFGQSAPATTSIAPAASFTAPTASVIALEAPSKPSPAISLTTAVTQPTSSSSGGFQFLGAGAPTSTSVSGPSAAAGEALACAALLPSSTPASSASVSSTAQPLAVPPPTFGGLNSGPSTAEPAKPSFSFGSSVPVSDLAKNKTEPLVGGFSFGTTLASGAGSSTSTFSLGQPQPSATSTTPVSASFQFGQPSVPPVASAPAVTVAPTFSFGSASSAVPSSSSAAPTLSFGAPSQNTAQQHTPSNGFMFGQQAQPQQPQQPAVAFGQPQQQAVAFGQPQPATVGTTGSLSFGQSQAATASPFSGLGSSSGMSNPPSFGQPPQQQQSGFGSSMPTFGQPQQQQPSTPAFSFGASNSASSFGAPQQPQQTSLSFGASSGSQPAFGGGQTPAFGQSSGSGTAFSFGQQSTNQQQNNQQQQPQTNAFTFGSNGGAGAPTPAFGAPSGATGSNNAAFSFGQTAPQQSTQQSMFNFGGGGSGGNIGGETSFSFGQANNSGFGAGAAPSNAAPSFSFGAGAGSSSAAPSTGGGTFVFGASGSAPAPTTGGLFNPGQMERKLAQPKQRGLRRK